MAYLVVTGPGREPFRRNLEGDRATVVGRALEVDLWVDDPRLSRRHCRITRAEGQWMIEDLSSTNGTWIERRRVGAAQLLRDGESVELGDTRLVFHAGSYIGARPADPKEARALEQMLSDSTVSRTSEDTLVHGHNGAPRPRDPRHPIPTPKPRQHAEELDPNLPLPFTRPPAKPILEDEPQDHLRGWLGALMGPRKSTPNDET